MTHLFKIPMTFADMFIRSISDDESEICYEVRDKETGNLVEPRRTTPFIINELNKRVHFDAREIPLDQFVLIYNTLQ